MKKEATKKPNKLLWLWIGLLALVLIAGAVVGAIFLFGGEKEPTGPVGGRPDLYWNLDKETYTKDSESGLSTREAGEDGVYRIRFAYNGEQVELPIVDKQLVNFIDTMDIMGLVKDADGMVVDVIAVEDIATPVAQNAYVQQVMSDRIIANSSIAMNGMQYTIELTDLTQLYDVSDTAELAGQIIEPTAFQAMDSIWVYANDLEEVTHIYMTEHPVTSAVYWRAYQMWSSAEKSTSRVPDENGVYSIDFCSEGGIVTLKCKDKSIVSSIDNKSPHSCHFGFIFDEEGYIIDIMNSGIGIRGAVAAERIEVTELDGNYFAGSQLIPSDSGLSYSATLPEGCPIYDASSAAARDGHQGELVDSLKLGDRICVWTDPMGTPMLVYIANRRADAEGYYNLSRQYDGTKKETKREPDAYGYYVFEMVKGGEIGKKTLKTKDKELATFIDAIANSIVGLKVENGIILNAYLDDDIYGWGSVYGGYVPQVQGMILSLVSFAKPDSPTNILMNAGYKAYDISGKDVPYGTETTVRVGDVITVTRDVNYNGILAYVTRRMVGGDNNAYYNLDYQYNSTTKETKRLPDADGYYVFTMAHKGKQVTVKTKDKELANKIDKSPVGDLVCIMRVENGIAYELYDTQSAYGQVLRSGYRVKSINGDGTYTVYASNGVDYVLKMADDCIMYNVSTVYDSHRGERCYSLKVGDMVTSLADYRGNVKLIYVRQRAVDNIYVNKQRMYDSSNKVTLREPDAEGKYWFELAVDGELKKFWTKDVALASQVDAYSTPFGLRVKDDQILNVTAATYAGKARTTPVNGWDVTSVSKYSIGVQFNKIGYTNTGEKQTLTVGSNVKVFDISPTAEQFGQKVELKVGDRILAYGDAEKNLVYIYVLFHDSRVKGSTGYCEHCKQTVKWLPWAGGSWDGYDGHYYLAGDIQYSGQSNIGNQNKNYEIVLDLNGKKYEAIGSRGVLIRFEDTLTIIDSVGGGSFAATGINGNGGTVLMASGGILNLRSGTLTFVDSENATVKNGSVIYADNSTINVYGGKITGGVVNTSETNLKYIFETTAANADPNKMPNFKCHALGGNMFIANKSVLNMYGGVIENGQAVRSNDVTWTNPAGETFKVDIAAQGGNIYAGTNSVINLYEGAEIRNGYSNQHGGNVFISTATLNVLGGKVYGGECAYSGGNIYNQFAGVLNLVDGVVENGTAGAAGNNVYGPHDSGEYHFSGGKITGDLAMSNAKTISVSGNAKVTNGSVCGLTIPSNVKLVVGELKDGAEIYVNASGAFSEPNAKNKAYVEAGYIKAAAARTEVTAIDNVLVMQGEVSYCEHCGTEVEWAEWSGKTNPASGHYFIGKDFKQSGQLSIMKDTDVVLDLYGHTYSSTKIRNFLVRGTLSIMDSIGGGEMVSTGGAEFAGAIALVGTEADSQRPSGFNLYSGTLRLDTENAEFATFANGGLIAFSGGELNVYGGTMIGGYVTQNGGVIRANGADSIVNIMGGTIKGGTSGGLGGCIYSYNSVNMVGGTVEGEIYIEKGDSLFAGAPVVSELTLAKGVLIDINGLTDGASIGVNADGVFTTELEAPADYLQYVHSADEYKDIVPADNALMAKLGKGYFDDYNSIHVEAEKMTEDGVFANGGVVTAICPVCGTEEQWVEITSVANIRKIETDGHYYLADDITFTDNHIGIYANVCVHLNGKNITSNERAFYVEATTKNIFSMNIMGEGIVTGAGVTHAKVPRGVVDVGGSVNFYGGTYVATGAQPAMTARGFNGSSIINIYDGAEFAGNSVNMLVASQGVNVYGGKFTSGTSKIDGASSNSLNIYGGTFANNGQVISATGAKGVLNISGGEISGTVAVAADFGTFTVSGDPVISNLDLTSGKLAAFNYLMEGASVGINAIGAFTEEFTNAKAYLDAGYIKGANSGIVVTEENGVLYAEVAKVYCEHCQQMVEWKTWPGHTSPVSGHYYIDGDFTQAGQYSIVNDTDVVLDLRGHTYSSVKIRNFLVRGTLSIVDTVGGGQMVTTGGKSYAGGIALVGKDGATTGTPAFNLYSGTLKLDTENPAFETFANGGLFWVTGAGVEMNIYGGTVIGGNVSQNGGAIKVESDATLNINGGVITGGTADVAGGCVAVVNAHMTMNGGEVDGDVFVNAAAGNVAISGASKIKELVIEKGALVDISGLTAGAQIGVKAEGVFTKALTNAENYLAYFVKLNDADEYYVENGAIGVAAIDPIDLANAIHLAAEKMTADGVFAAGGTVTATCPVCGTEEQWIEITTVANMRKIDTAGHYYLADDITMNDTHIGFYTDACLHLNGNDITSTERAFYVDADHTKNTHAHINIMGEGTVSAYGTAKEFDPPRGAIDLGGSVNFYGGTYVATSAQRPTVTARGYIANKTVGTSVINIYDGAEFIAPAVSLHVRTHITNVYGGTFTSGVVKVNGAGAGELNIYGGTFENTNADQVVIEATGSKAALNIAGGVINGEITVSSDFKAVNVSGTPVISNLNLSSGKKLTVGELEYGADILVTAENAFTDALTNAADVVAYFGATDSAMEVVVVNNALVVRESAMAKGNLVHEAAEQMTADGVFNAGGDIVALCPVCETEATWKNLNAVTAKKFTADGHYYLSDNLVMDSHFNNTQKNICVHLNGYDITSAGRTFYVEYGTLNIMGEGVVTGAHSNEAQKHFASNIDATGNVNLYGGTYTGRTDKPVISSRSNKDHYVKMYEGASVVRDASVPGLNVHVIDKGGFVMYGGTISGATRSDVNGANVLVQARGNKLVPNFTMYGGVIENGTAVKGANIYATGAGVTVNICGGTIRNGDVYAETDISSLNVSGNAMVSEMNLSSGKKLSVGVLKSGAEITVTADGVFTEPSAYVEKFVDFFKASAENKQVVAEGNELKVTSK